MSRKDFDEFLSSKEKEHGTERKIDWDEQKNEWLSYLEELYKRFEETLKDYKQQDKVKIVYGETEITEEYIGSYKARASKSAFEH